METDVEELVTCLETQLTELETLRCIFSEEELSQCNEETIAKAEELCSKFRRGPNASDNNIFLREIFNLKCLSFDLSIPLLHRSKDAASDKLSNVLNINFLLPHSYPKESPKVYLSSDQLTRDQQSACNDKLTDYIEENKTENPIVYQIVDWIRENSEVFINLDEQKFACKNANNGKQISNINKLTVKCKNQATMWLYMHHIYNKEKRKDIINWAKELELSGFSLPGKPGVVYVEGSEENVDNYFARLKRLSWKRMSCIQKEAMENICKTFDDFQELNFNPHGSRDYHMDMGKFHIFLKENGLGSMFAVLFGIKDD